MERVRVPLSAEEHAALERLAMAERRSLGAQAAVMLAPLLRVPVVLPAPWQKHPTDVSTWERRRRGGDLCAHLWRTADGWHWRTYVGGNITRAESAKPCSTPEAAMAEADAALEGT